MATKIPLTSAGDRRMKISLGDNVLTLRTYYNRVMAFWVLDILTDDGDPIAEGLNMVGAINLLEASKTLTHQYGQFRLDKDATGENSLEDIGFYWFAPGEFEALVPEELFFSPPLNYDFDLLFPRVVVSG
ncbi:hypothetical protein F9L16_23905 [Agarivorans sp. B2Z047]|uniref:phage baseplate plug family protein n=1 Tax=Agarivorans sp. B2Z047 TaxID=2652721 RepID=UPI00128B216D|nr:hypothetical protein [Agarivorans sp. B2Z047]MPW31995.1 hypothetical protein [Agarivorans sp. B2Z047]UQN41867.1 hypothetical protein LQZ07_19125 [Agarivorans sp. B2Z047]